MNYYVNKYDWNVRSTIFHKAIRCRKTYKMYDDDKKMKTIEHINQYLKNCEHKSHCYLTSTNFNIIEIEIVIAVEGNIHQQKKSTQYIRENVDKLVDAPCFS